MISVIDNLTKGAAGQASADYELSNGLAANDWINKCANVSIMEVELMF